MPPMRSLAVFGLATGVLVGCASPARDVHASDDPVVAEARDRLVALHPRGARLAGQALPDAPTRRARIAALLERLEDPSTRLLDREAWAAFLAEVSGAPTVGVGLRELLDLDLAPDGRVVVVTTQPGGPAACAGLGPGDTLVAVDGAPLSTLDEAMARLRGPAGSDVRVTVRRAGVERTLTLRRASLPPAGDGVRAGMLADGTLHLAIDGFAAQTPAAVLRALGRPDVRAVVLDLRNDPGGEVDAALAVAGAFLGERDVARTVGVGAPEPLRTSGRAVFDGPVVVLVNEGTASAAELVALALRTAHRARIVGARTAGKALLHVPAALEDGSVLLVSTARITALDGSELLARGLVPDVANPAEDSDHPPLPVPGDPRRDARLGAAVAELARR